MNTIVQRGRQTGYSYTASLMTLLQPYIEDYTRYSYQIQQEINNVMRISELENNSSGIQTEEFILPLREEYFPERVDPSTTQGLVAQINSESTNSYTTPGVITVEDLSEYISRINRNSLNREFVAYTGSNNYNPFRQYWQEEASNTVFWSNNWSENHLSSFSLQLSNLRELSEEARNNAPEEIQALYIAKELGHEIEEETIERLEKEYPNYFVKPKARTTRRGARSRRNDI